MATATPDAPTTEAAAAFCCAEITIFTSIPDIASSLRNADPALPLRVIADPALSGYGGTVHFDPADLRSDTKSMLQRATILISEPFVVAQLLKYDPDALKNLRWCQSTYAGVDPLFAVTDDDDRVPRPSWTLTRFAGRFGPPMAEWCVARIIGHERDFAASSLDQTRKRWAGSDAILGYRYLSSLTLAVLGCGDIGCCIARAAKAFGMRVVGYGRRNRTLQSEKGDDNEKEEDDAVLQVMDEYTTNLSEALQQADYIVSVLPSTPRTRGLLDGHTLSSASETNGGKCPVLLNAGRGDIVTEDSLLRALDERWIAAAILDVFPVEPLPKTSPLWERSDVVISPHVSGLTQASDVPKVFLENYARFVEGRELNYVVDWEKGY